MTITGTEIAGQKIAIGGLVGSVDRATKISNAFTKGNIEASNFTQLTEDVTVSTFIGGNRLHNRIYSVSPYQNQNIIIYDNKKRAFISPIDGSSKVISKTYSRDGAEITKLAMKLALQYRLLEQVLKQQEELKLVRHI